MKGTEGKDPEGVPSGVGIELEYMIVDRETLDVLPVCDEVIRSVSGAYDSEIERGPLRWSNELVLHVIELKTNGPASDIEALPAQFQADVETINGILEPMNGRLLPSAMHPWMNPERETHLWPHEYSPVYEAYDSIFGCRGHGWSNLQSMHINLPFAGDDDFGRIHAAVRLILPLLSGLAAASPVMDGRVTGFPDTRLEVYRKNQAGFPSVAGRIVPEPVYTEREYEEVILEPMYRDLAPYDSRGILRHEWLNSRGAIARFDRGTIEIRVLDIAECPLMDLTIAAAVRGLLDCLMEETWTSTETQKGYPQDNLARFFDLSIAEAERTPVKDAAYLAQFGFPDAGAATVGDVWRHLFETELGRRLARDWHTPMEFLIERGPLARRILERLGPRPSEGELHRCYADLGDCLATGTPFGGASDSDAAAEKRPLYS